MYNRTIHITLNFKGTINRTFKFTRIFNEVTDNIEDFIKEKDGYLFIKGVRITNHQKSMDKICETIHSNRISDNGLSYVESTLVIDNEGYIIIEKHRHAASKAEMIFSKLL